MVRKKLIGLGIKDRKELQQILGCSQSMANKLWYGQVGHLTPKMAIIIKKKTGASLDFLLS